MKQNIVITIIIVLSSLSRYSLAQSIQLPTKVGDNISEYTLNNLINYPSKTAKISDFKGKFLILDFWATSCSSCIASWPKLHRLQEQFRDEIQIILVNPWEEETIVRSLFEKRKKYANVNVTLPTVCKDSVLLELFNISGVPQIVWVDNQGTVISITYDASVNEKNINDLLNEKTVDMPQSIGTDELISIELDKPLFINGNGDADVIFYHSVFGKGNKKLFPNLRIPLNSEIDEGRCYAAAINQSILSMYRLAYSDDSPGSFYGIQQSRVFLEVENPGRYKSHKKSGEIVRDNLYTYQLVSRLPKTRDQLKSMMQADLKRYVGLDAYIEKRKVKCLVFTARDTSLIAYKKGGYRSLIDDTIVDLNNITMSHLIENMYAGTKYHYSSYPIIDETGYKGKLGDLKVNANAEDYTELDKALRKYGMRFKLAEREVDVLVIREPEGYQFPFNNEYSIQSNEHNQ